MDTTQYKKYRWLKIYLKQKSTVT